MSVLDTTFFIDLFRRDPGAAQLWESLRSGEEVAAYSTVTVFELWRGRLSLGEGDFYNDLMVLLEEMSLTAAARRAASWLRNLPPASAERLIRDAMVAASAAERDEPVYTRNHHDFSRFEGIEVLGY